MGNSLCSKRNPQQAPLQQEQPEQDILSEVSEEPDEWEFVEFWRSAVPSRRVITRQLWRFHKAARTVIVILRLRKQWAIMGQSLRALHKYESRLRTPAPGDSGLMVWKQSPTRSQRISRFFPLQGQYATSPEVKARAEFMRRLVRRIWSCMGRFLCQYCRTPEICSHLARIKGRLIYKDKTLENRAHRRFSIYFSTQVWLATPIAHYHLRPVAGRSGWEV